MEIVGKITKYLKIALKILNVFSRSTKKPKKPVVEKE